VKPENVFQLEIAGVLSDKLSLFLRFGFTWLVALPLTILPVSPGMSISGLMMLFLLTTFFGAVIATARRRSEGLFSRLRLLPLSRAQIGGDYLLAGTLLGVVRLTPVLILFALVRGEKISASLLLHVAGLLVVTVFVLHGAGMLVGMVRKSNQEAHLLGALATGLIALVSDVLPVHAGMQGFARAWNPLSMLAGSLERVFHGAGSSEASQALACGLVLVAALVVFVWRGLAGKFAGNPTLPLFSKGGLGGFGKGTGQGEDPGDGKTAPRE